jgi:aminomethyltransferase
MKVSAALMGRLCPAAAALTFMSATKAALAGAACHISRSGYTGEDGFEIALAADEAERVALALLAEDGVALAGLGARDCLRLEAGLCLYGHDLDESVSPVEAALEWSIQKRRRADGDFPGAARVRDELAHGPARRRVGIRPDGRAPAREGTPILTAGGAPIGRVTSGGFGPSLDAPLAMGYVAMAQARAGERVRLMVRNKPLAAAIVPLPFLAHRYASR